MPEPDPQPSVQPTGWQTVVASAIVGIGVGWLSAAVPDGVGWPLPSPPWIASALIAVAAVAVGVMARSTHLRVQIRRESLHPEHAVRLLVLGKATLLVGAAMAGGYAAMIGYVVERAGIELLSARGLIGVAAVVASILLAIAGGSLQRACKIPGPPNGDATPPQLPGSPRTPD